MLQYFDREFRTNQTYIGLTGKVTRRSQDISGFASGLKGLTSDREINLNLTIDEVTSVGQGPRTATLTAKITMDLVVNGKSAEKGGFSVNMAATKSEDDGKWRFVHSDQIRTVEERQAGNCISYFYERKNGFVTEVYYPIGFEYEKNLDVFTMKMVDGKRTININYRQYEWDNDGKVLDVYNDTKTEIGSSNDPKEAITFILGQMYGDNCLGFSVK